MAQLLAAQIPIRVEPVRVARGEPEPGCAVGLGQFIADFHPAGWRGHGGTEGIPLAGAADGRAGRRVAHQQDGRDFQFGLTGRPDDAAGLHAGGGGGPGGANRPLGFGRQFGRRSARRLGFGGDAGRALGFGGDCGPGRRGGLGLGGSLGDALGLAGHGWLRGPGGLGLGSRFGDAPGLAGRGCHGGDNGGWSSGGGRLEDTTGRFLVRLHRILRGERGGRATPYLTGCSLCATSGRAQRKFPGGQKRGSIFP